MIGSKIDTDDEWREITSKIELGSPIDNWIKIHKADTLNVSAFHWGDDRYVISLKKLKCVPLEEIDMEEAWNESRVLNVDEWGTSETLMSARIRESYEDYAFVTVERELPRMNRFYDIANNKYSKYNIGDGIHRTDRARRLGLPCVMAIVTEELKISKELFPKYSERSNDIE